MLVARAFYDGAFQGGLSWTEATAEAVFVLVAAFIAPGRKRLIAGLALGFFICRDVATVRYAPTAVTPADAAIAVTMATLATALVWWQTRR